MISRACGNSGKFTLILFHQTMKMFQTEASLIKGLTKHLLINV